MSWEVWGMSLKISLFNKAFFVSDIKRYWWIGLAQTLFIFVFSLLPVYTSCNGVMSGNLAWDYDCSPTWNFAFLTILPFAVGMMSKLFNFIHFGASAGAIHALPLKRGTLFLTKMITGMIILFIPVIINAGIMFLMSTSFEFATVLSSRAVVKWLLTGISYTMFFAALTVLVSMMTGSSAATLVFSFSFIVLPAVLILFVQNIMDAEIYGYVYENRDWLLKAYGSIGNNTQKERAVAYFVIAVVFMIFSYIFYKKRKLEVCGEILAFSWLKPVFVGIVAIFGSIFGYGCFAGILNKTGIIWIMPGGILFIIAAIMIEKKKITFKGLLLPIVIYSICALGITAVIEFDLMGFERKVPDVSEVETVTVSIGEDFENIYFREEDILDVINVHKYFISQEDVKKGTDVLLISYNLKGDETIKREYNIDLNEDMEILNSIR